MSVFFKQDNLWVLKEGVSNNASINDCAKAMGYDHNQFYSYTNYNCPYDYDNNSDSILTVCLKVMTEDIICVITNPGRTSLSDMEVRHYMEDFIFSSAYSLYSMESDLDSAIAEHNFSIQFVAEALKLPYSPDDKILYSSRLKYNFIFDGGYLVGYETADGYNRQAHELKNDIPNFYQLLDSHARNYHRSNEADIVKEINIQAKAFENLPGGVKNEYFYEFKNADNSFNVAMLLVTKYQGTEYELCLNYEECKCICHNELVFEGESVEGLDKILRYKYRDYILSFDGSGHFLSCKEELQGRTYMGSSSMNNYEMEKKVVRLDFKLGNMAYDSIEILKGYLTELSHGKAPSCYIYSLGGTIGCYDDDDNLFYIFPDSELKEWVQEEGLLIGVFGIDKIDAPDIEGVITLPLSVFFHAKECEDKYETAIYSIRVLHMEELRRKGITF